MMASSDSTIYYYFYYLLLETYLGDLTQVHGAKRWFVYQNNFQVQKFHLRTK